MSTELPKWINVKAFEDIEYHKAEGIAKITINRPEVRNAFRPQTIVEISQALEVARSTVKPAALAIADTSTGCGVLK